MKDKFINILKKKWLTDGLMTFFLIIIIIATYLGISFYMKNTVFNDIDLTESKLYSLSEESISKVKNIDKPIKITLINYSKDEYISDFSNKYTLVNKNIEVDTVSDITSRADLVQKYGVSDGSSLIIVGSQDKEITLTEYDLFTYDYTTYEQIDRTEEAITNAIINVSIEDKPKIYFMTGHNNYPIEYFYTLFETLEAEANEVKTVDIFANGKVPEDCDTLVITTLSSDILEAEKDYLIDYIGKGGNILLLHDPRAIIDTNSEFTNFKSVLLEFGFDISDGYIIEENASNIVVGSPEFIICDVSKYNDITSNINEDMRTTTIYSGRLEFESEDKLEEKNVTYQEIAKTSNTAFLREKTVESFDRTDEDIDAGNSVVSAIVTKKISDDVSSKIVAFASGIFVTDISVGVGNYGIFPFTMHNNKDMILNSVAYLNDMEDSIIIRKTADNVSYTVTKEQNRIILFIILSIPVEIIIAGIIVWVVRRRKR